MTAPPEVVELVQRLHGRIDATDRQIAQPVYELYDQTGRRSKPWRGERSERPGGETAGK